ncbi:hypothetical protein HZS_372 [Henneguya salminicola]|nr:hypothetical protein HZS_372 [Henneguya salminicola]
MNLSSDNFKDILEGVNKGQPLSETLKNANLVAGPPNCNPQNPVNINGCGIDSNVLHNADPNKNSLMKKNDATNLNHQNNLNSNKKGEKQENEPTDPSDTFNNLFNPTLPTTQSEFPSRLQPIPNEEQFDEKFRQNI